MREVRGEAGSVAVVTDSGGVGVELKDCLSVTPGGYAFSFDEKKFAAALRTLADRIDPVNPERRQTVHLRSIEVSDRTAIDEFLVTRLSVEFSAKIQPVLSDEDLADLATVNTHVPK